MRWPTAPPPLLPQPYWFGGCGATSNLHSNQLACWRACGPPDPLVLAVTAPSDSALLHLLSSSPLPLLVEESLARKVVLGSLRAVASATIEEAPGLRVAVVDTVVGADREDVRRASRAVEVAGGGWGGSRRAEEGGRGREGCSHQQARGGSPGGPCGGR